MKKRLLSIFTALAMCLTLLPTTALAAETVNYLWQGSDDKIYYSATLPTDLDSTSGTELATSGSCYELPAGTYKLAEDITTDKTIENENNSNVTLDLNGYVLKYNNTTTAGSVLCVNGGSFSLNDSVPNNQPDGRDTTLPSGGIITGGTGFISGGSGGGVYVMNGVFNMFGGTITGCTADDGGGVFVCNGDEIFNMNGGTITNCSTSYGDHHSGGGVFVGSGSTFNMSGGIINNCSANGKEAKGGGVINNSGNFTMAGTATISDCSVSGTDSQGGSVYVNGSYLTMGVAGIGENIGILAGSNGKTNDVYIPNSYTCGIKLAGGTTDENCLPIASAVTNNTTIEGGKFSGTVTNNSTISGGNFSGTVTNNSGGSISGGSFSGTVTNKGTISSGSFAQGITVINESGGSFRCDTTGINLKHAVTFNTDGGSTAPDTQYVAHRGKVTRPADPTKTGSHFMFWKCDGNFLDFETYPITTPTTLTAEWGKNGKELPYTTEIKQGAADTPPPQTFRLMVWATHRSNDVYNFSSGGELPYNAYGLTGHISLTTNSGPSCVDKNVTISYRDTYIFPMYGVLVWQVPVNADGNAITSSDGWTYDETVYICQQWGDNIKIFNAIKQEDGSYKRDDSELTTITFTHTYTKGTVVSSNDSAPTYSVTAPAVENGTVSVRPRYAEQGDTVVVTVTPDEGYTLESLKVTDRHGNELTLTDNGDGTYSFKMPASRVEIKATFIEDNFMLNFFTDVPADSYYYDAVLWAAKQGITGGVDQTHFAPDAACNRSQIVTFLYRLATVLGVDLSIGEDANILSYRDASDIPDYAIPAFQWAVGAGIIQGDNGQLMSGDECTRAQMVTLLYRFATVLGMDMSVGEDTNILSYSDAMEIPEYAIPAFQWAVGAGIIQGNNGQLMSEAVCTRAQIVTILYRLLGE